MMIIGIPDESDEGLKREKKRTTNQVLNPSRFSAVDPPESHFKVNFSRN